MTGYYAPSEEELNTKLDYDVLPEDEYIILVKDIKIEKDKPNNYPSKSDPGPIHDELLVLADVLTFENGDPLEDTDRDPIEGNVPIRFWLNPKKVGLLPVPAKARKFFAAVLGQPLSQPINIPDYTPLIGKKLIAALKPEKGYNNVKDFRAISRGRTRATTNKGPVDAEELIAKTKEVFNEDSPTNTSPVAAGVNSEDLDF